MTETSSSNNCKELTQDTCAVDVRPSLPHPRTCVMRSVFSWQSGGTFDRSRVLRNSTDYFVSSLLPRSSCKSSKAVIGLRAQLTFVSYSIGSLPTTLPIAFVLQFSTILALACLSANCFRYATSPFLNSILATCGAGLPSLNTAGGVIGLVASYYGAISRFYLRRKTFKAIRVPQIDLTYDP
ncbi:hypothetical protein BKA93DRAFT_490235 [Sparassis latifolia]